MKRRSMGIAILAATALAVTGCGGPGESETPQAQELRVWFPGNLPEEMAWVNDTLVPAFEKEHDGVSVEVEFVGWGDLSTRLSTAFAGGTAPDIFGHGNAAAAGFAASDRVLDLDSYVDALPAEDRDDLILMDHGKVNGTQYIVPLRGFGLLLAYRTDLFEEAGLDPQSPPSDWAELKADAEKLTVKEGDNITRSGYIITADNPTSMSQAFGAALFQNGGSFLSDDGSEITWDSPEAVEALSFLASLYNGPDAVATGLNEATNGTGAQHPLVTGRAAMALIDEATLKTIYEQAPDIAEKIAVAPPLTEVEQASFGGAGNGLFISSDSKNADLAWEFIKFMINPENAKAYVQVVGGIPARASLATDPDLVDVPYIKSFADAAAMFHGNPNVPTWTQLRDVLSAEIEKALHGQTSAEDALKAAAEAAQTILKG